MNSSSRADTISGGGLKSNCLHLTPFHLRCRTLVVPPTRLAGRILPGRKGRNRRLGSGVKKTRPNKVFLCSSYCLTLNSNVAPSLGSLIRPLSQVKILHLDIRFEAHLPPECGRGGVARQHSKLDPIDFVIGEPFLRFFK